MLDVRALHSSELVQIRDVHCSAPRGECGSEEAVPAYNLVLPISGAFTWHTGSRRTLVDCNSAMLLSPKSTYRVSHPIAGGDRCLSLRYTADGALEAFGSNGTAPKHWLLDKNMQARTRRLLHHLLSIPESLLAEETALELLHLVAALPHLEPSKALSDVSERVREYVNARFSVNDGLSDIASAVGYSPFHLSRMFRAATGITIHQYRLGIRLAASIERLRRSDEPIARIAVDLGFCDHSHFGAEFALAFGVSPGRIRNTLWRSRHRV